MLVTAILRGKESTIHRGGGRGQMPAQLSHMQGTCQAHWAQGIAELAARKQWAWWPAELESCMSGSSGLRSSLCGAHSACLPGLLCKGGRTPPPAPHTSPSNQCTFRSVASLRCRPQGLLAGWLMLQSPGPLEEHAPSHFTEGVSCQLSGRGGCTGLWP